MKRFVILIGSALIVIGLGGWLYYEHRFKMYPENAIVSDTGIKTFTVLTKVHNNYEWYAKILIKATDGDRLLTRYPFHTGFSRAVVGGKTFDATFPDCSECWYYIDNENGSAYDYHLYVLNGDKTELLVYEVFGN